MTHAGNDSLEFAAEHDTGTSASDLVWKVLIVDDEADVHDATRIALRNVEVCQRPLRFLHAYTAAEAREQLRQNPDTAVVLLDVVMESERAGLELVKQIRTDLGLASPRIVLRTGQPGYAPEIEAIRDFDINDYRIKSELTRTRLFAMLTSAIRSFAQLRQLENDQIGLERLLQMQADILAEHRLTEVAETVIRGASNFLDAACEGVFCAPNMDDDGRVLGARVIAALGDGMQHWIGEESQFRHFPGYHQIVDAFLSGRHVPGSAGIAIRLPSRTGAAFVAFICGATTLPHSDPRFFELFVRDAASGTDNVLLLERLREAAFVDGLTGTGNRAALSDAIDQRFRSKDRTPLRLLLVDVDQFSEINETFGDRLGDALLREVAQRLQGFGRTGVQVARVANDTFAVFGPRDALQPDTWSNLFDRDFDVEGVAIGLSASFGVVDLDNDQESGGAAIKKGYSALKQAKQGGHRNIAYYSPEVGAEIKQRTQLLYGLRKAFERRQLSLAYQPQVCAVSGRSVGVEALMRWTGDDGRPVSPAAFIPVAEQSGLIRELGTWALRQAIGDAMRLRAAGHGDLRMAVNVSMAQLLVDGFEALVASLLAEAGLPAHLLELEVTESVAMEAPETVLPKLAAIKALGVQVAIDDFGTGFSSLSSLDKLPADRLKIDRSFVQSLAATGGEARIAAMVVELGRTLGLQVIAEGVETAEQRERLLQLGCHELQGYLFAKPMAIEALEPWLSQRA